MKNKICSLASLLAALITIPAIGAPLTPEEALQRVNSSGGRRAVKIASFPTTPVYTKTAADGKPAAYVFVGEQTGNGFMIISADDMAYPVLGYSDSGSFDPSNVPPQLQSWLDGYAAQIEYARSNAMISSSHNQNAPYALNDAFEAIEPLVKTKWNQDAPFNALCPTDSRQQRCFTGCVATAMAQVINYYQYPAKPTGSVQYSPITLDNKVLTMNFDSITFDWDNMLDTYDEGKYSDAQKNAVATLMQVCGYAVKMDYSPIESATYTTNILGALVNNFGFDPSVRYVSRSVYSPTQWAALIYDNLKNVGPILYDGTAFRFGSHSFICDGYDGEGFFHFNWGWGGVSDGYYSLEAINPEMIGIGGFAGGFNADQDIVIGIRVPDGKNYSTQPNLTLLGTAEGQLKNNTISFTATSTIGYNKGLYNNNYTAEAYRFGAIFESTTDSLFQPLTVEGKIGVDTIKEFAAFGDLTMGTYTMPNVEIPASLPDGSYIVTLATKSATYPNAEWLPIQASYGSSNYVLLQVADGDYTLANQPAATLTILEASMSPDTIIFGSSAVFKMTIANNTKFELSQPFNPSLGYGEALVMMGDTRMISVAPGDTLEVEWATSLRVLESWFMVDQPLDLDLYIYNANNGEYLGYFGKVLLYPEKADLKVTAQNFYIDYVGSAQMNVGGKTVTVYRPDDPTEMTVRITLDIEGGYFDGDLFITAEGAEGNGLSTGIEEIFRRQYDIVAGTFNKRVTVSYPNADPQVIYRFTLFGDYNGTQTQYAETYMKLSDNAGVEDMEVNEAPAEYYDLQGIRVTDPVPGSILIRIVPGKATEKIRY